MLVHVLLNCTKKQQQQQKTLLSIISFFFLVPKTTTTTHYIVIFVSVCVAMFLVSCPKQEVGEGLGEGLG